MLSLIICSRSADVLAALSKDVANTIKVPYEIVAIDNSEGDYGLCAAYNIGVTRANFEYICFLHEDVSFKTNNWGEIVVRLFEDNKKLGLLGVVGSSYKTFIPSGWIAPHAKQGYYANLLQSFKDKRNDLYLHTNPKKQALAKVISVDGVWFCTRKSIAKEIKFDEHTFKGFHCYDVDFSLSVGQKYEVAVTFEILINHFSEGSFDKDWAAETIKLHKKWQRHLPLAAEQLSKEVRADLEFKAFHGILPKILDNRLLLIAVLKDVMSFKMLSLVGVKRTTTMVALLVKKMLSAS